MCEQNVGEVVGCNVTSAPPVVKRVECLYCEQATHTLERCYKFRNKSYKERFEFVRKEKLCDNCLRRNHLARIYRLNATCLVGGCESKHHSLLHPPMKRSASADGLQNASKDRANHNTQVSPPRNVAGTSGKCSAVVENRKKVSFRIVPVRVSNEDKTREIETYAFIDSGSDTTLCTKDLAKELELSGEPRQFTLTTLNSQNTSRSGQEVTLSIVSLDGTSNLRINEVWTVDSLPVSEQSIPSVEDLQRWPHLTGIDFPRLEEGKVTILIGSNVPEAHWIFEERRGRPKEPLAAKMLLGWTLLGPMTGDNKGEANINFLCTRDQEAIDSQIQRLYNTEFSEKTSNTIDMAMSVEDKEHTPLWRILFVKSMIIIK